MRNKKTLSIQSDVLKKGQKRADEMFSGNFSMYVTYLINKDVKGIREVHSYNDELAITEEPRHNTRISSAIDNIIGNE